MSTTNANATSTTTTFDENDILNNYINASNAEVKLEKDLDDQIKTLLSTMEENNRIQRNALMALIDERYYITDSVEEYNERLRRCFNISHLPTNASRLEIFTAATDAEIYDYGL